MSDKLINNIDISILNFIRENLRSDFLDKLMTAITSLGNGGFVFIALGLALLVSKKERILGKALLIAMIANAILVNLVLKPLVARTRPFDFVEGVDLIIKKPGDYSFPSGHTSVAFAFASAVYYFARSKGFKTLAIAFAILMGLSRLYLYVHYPTDVIFGGIFGWMCGIFAKVAYEKSWFGKIFEKRIE